MHSAASSAPIKITLKDDTLGLGAKIRQKQAEDCTGLDVFKDLLGRLNGESDEAITKKQNLRSEIKTSLYVERRFGAMRFVKGGLLVGDQTTELVKQAADSESTPANVPTEAADTMIEDNGEVSQSKSEKKEKKSKKRKAEETDVLIDPVSGSAEIKKKKKKRSRDDASEDQSSSDSERKRRKKEKKERKAREAQGDTVANVEETESKSKKGKKDKKDKKEKKKRKEAADIATGSPSSIAPTVIAASGSSTPAGTGTSTPQPMSRHMVRARNIASKRMAMADMAALQQVGLPHKQLKKLEILTTI